MRDPCSRNCQHLIAHDQEIIKQFRTGSGRNLDLRDVDINDLLAASLEEIEKLGKQLRQPQSQPLPAKPMGYPVHLTQVVFKNKQVVGAFTKRVTLPIPPAAGMGVALQKDFDEEIAAVYMNSNMAVICELKPSKWKVGDGKKCDAPESEWPDILKRLTAGMVEYSCWTDLWP